MLKALAMGLAIASITCSSLGDLKNQEPNSTAEDSGRESVVTDTTHTIGRNTDFAYKVNAQMDAQGNYVFSPYSLKAALAMSANGASGVTRDEILSVLGYNSITELNSDMKELCEKYNTDGALKLSTANSVWVRNTYPQLAPDFTAAMQSTFDASAQRCTLTELPKKMSAWVEEKSNGLQKGFKPAVDDSFAIALMNTTYLKAKWTSSFEAEASRKGIFRNADGTDGTVTYMHKVFNKEIYKDDRVAMVKLDYMDSSLSFYAAMAPDNTDLSQYVDKLESKRISLSLPKFKIDSGISLNSAVKALGAGTMFSSNADFSNVFGDNIGLAVSSVIQDTVIDVDEEGTEAASTTMIGMVGTAYNPEQPIEMNFNQPFTYFIMDNDNGEILFMGKFATAQ